MDVVFLECYLEKDSMADQCIGNWQDWLERAALKCKGFRYLTGFAISVLDGKKWGEVCGEMVGQ